MVFLVFQVRVSPARMFAKQPNEIIQMSAYSRHAISGPVASRGGSGYAAEQIWLMAYYQTLATA